MCQHNSLKKILFHPSTPKAVVSPLTSPESSHNQFRKPDDTFVIIITLNLYNAQSLLWAIMFFLPTNSFSALFYAVRQFYAMAIFLMGRLDTYGVGQKLWSGLASKLAATP